MMQNLMNIEQQTGGAHWLKNVNEELARQKKVVTLREGTSPTSQLLDRFPEKLMNIGRKLFGRPEQNTELFGETSGPGGLPFGSSNVYVNPAPSFNNPYSQSLKGRNPYVQSLVDTMRHELGGHVAEQLTPGGPSFSFSNPTGAATIREGAAQGVTGEEPQTPRGLEVQKYMYGEDVK